MESGEKTPFQRLLCLCNFQVFSGFGYILLQEGVFSHIFIFFHFFSVLRFFHVFSTFLFFFHFVLFFYFIFFHFFSLFFSKIDPPFLPGKWASQKLHFSHTFLHQKWTFFWLFLQQILKNAHFELFGFSWGFDKKRKIEISCFVATLERYQKSLKLQNLSKIRKNTKKWKKLKNLSKINICSQKHFHFFHSVGEASERILFLRPPKFLRASAWRVKQRPLSFRKICEN